MRRPRGYRDGGCLRVQRECRSDGRRAAALAGGGWAAGQLCGEPVGSEGEAGRDVSVPEATLVARWHRCTLCMHNMSIVCHPSYYNKVLVLQGSVSFIQVTNLCMWLQPNNIKVVLLTSSTLHLTVGEHQNQERRRAALSPSPGVRGLLIGPVGDPGAEAVPHAADVHDGIGDAPRSLDPDAHQWHRVHLRGGGQFDARYEGNFK